MHLIYQQNSQFFDTLLNIILNYIIALLKKQLKGGLEIGTHDCKAT
jgi:hypothetical protein